MSRSPALIPAFAVCAVLLTVVSGCGYSHSALYSSEYRSVSVSIFENRTFWRGVEFDLKEALVKEIELRTPYKVVDAEHADTALVGKIMHVEQDVLSRREDGGLPQELEWSMVVDFDWSNQRDGRVIRQRKGFTAVGRYVPAIEGGEQYQTAQHEAVQRMADAIVSAMGAGW